MTICESYSPCHLSEKTQPRFLSLLFKGQLVWAVLIFSDAQWPWEEKGILFGWLSLKGNPSQKKRGKWGATGQLGF